VRTPRHARPCAAARPARSRGSTHCKSGRFHPQSPKMDPAREDLWSADPAGLDPADPTDPDDTSTNLTAWQ